jgi:hypothetical protein
MLIKMFEELNTLRNSLGLELDLPGRIISTDLTKSVNEITSIYSSYVVEGNSKYVIDLYLFCLDKVFNLSAGKPGSAELSNHVISIVDKLKSQVLFGSVTKPRFLDRSDENSIQTLVQTHRLIPRGSYRPLNDLLMEEFGTKGALTSVSKALGVGFMVISKISPYPKVHDIRPLLTTAPEPSEYGVNIKNLQRTSTIRDLPNSTGSRSDGITLEAKESGEMNWVVLQTLDGNNYCVMSSFLGTPYSYKPPEALVPSARLAVYNSILNDEIMLNLGEPSIQPLSGVVEIAKADAYWNTIRTRLKRSILSLYSPDKKITRATIMQTMGKHVLLIARAAMEEMMFTSDVGELYKRELSTSYLREYNDILRRYSSKFGEIFDEAKRMDLSSPSKAISSIEPVIDEVLKVFINRRSGIFITLQNITDVLDSVFSHS